MRFYKSIILLIKNNYKWLQVYLERKNGEITFDPNVIGEKELCEAIEDMGFESSVHSEVDSCVIGVQGMTLGTTAKDIQGEYYRFLNERNVGMI